MTDRVLAVLGVDSRDHVNPEGHPETMARLAAVERSIERFPTVDVVRGRVADPAELALAHTPDHIAAIRELAASGGGALDDDTYVSEGTFRAALGAAGAGLTAIEHLTDGHGDDGGPTYPAAFVVARPPGHHATATTSMGMCIFNNIAVAATHLAAGGSRVAIIDWDAHHGNGTQEIFWRDDRVMYVSVHGDVTFPGTGNAHERGPAGTEPTTVNLPLPAGATGDVYLALFDEIVTPVVERFEPDWVLVSCGFDAHVDDPLTSMALTSADFGHLTRRVMAMAPPGRTVVFFEGGYDLEAVEASTAAVLTVLTGDDDALAPPSTGGPGAGRLAEFARIWLSDD